MSHQSRFDPRRLPLTPIWWRVLAFVAIFVLISGLTGSWVISTNKLLFPFYFSIYGSAGKVLLFGVLTFFLMARDKVLQIPVTKFERFHGVLLGLAAASVAGFFWAASQLLQFPNFGAAPALSLLAHFLLLLACSLALVGVFGLEYLRAVIRHCTQALVISLILATVFYFAFGFIYTLWPYLSAIVLWAVVQLLRITNPGAMVVPPLTIHLSEFAVTIGEYCSGIESLFLISVLYMLIGCLEWPRLKKCTFILGFLPLIIGMFGLNIVRVFVIIQAGILFSPQIAAKLFHTYLGMILFMTYFISFWKWFAPKVLIKPLQARK